MQGALGFFAPRVLRTFSFFSLLGNDCKGVLGPLTPGFCARPHSLSLSSGESLRGALGCFLRRALRPPLFRPLLRHVCQALLRPFSRAPSPSPPLPPSPVCRGLLALH